MKALFIIAVLAVLAYLFTPSCEKGRIGPLSPPFGVSYRESLIGRGIVATIQNRSNDILYDVTMKIDGPDGKSTSAKVADYLKPTETKDMGWMELNSWNLEVGEQIYIYAKGYPAPYVTSCNGVKQ